MPNLVDFFPVLKAIDPQGIRKRFTRHFGKILEILEELINVRVLTGRSKQGDALDVCLKINQDNPKDFTRSRTYQDTDFVE